VYKEGEGIVLCQIHVPGGSSDSNSKTQERAQVSSSSVHGGLNAGRVGGREEILAHLRKRELFKLVEPSGERSL